ncbi:MAG: CoA transferase subunit A [Candidatus Cloacimonetes bacterium]|nr:CoA transferase subunit A [Candidatus Cloacimonadota bacterium]
MPKIITAEQAAEMINPGDKILFGGFLAVGATENLIDALIEKNVKDLEMVVIATDYEQRGVGKLICNKQIKKIQTSHIGTNKSTQSQYLSGETQVELIPQGTLLERVRAAGAGLGGILTPTGIGTVVEENKQIIEVDGQEYILETPIKGRYAFIRADKADKYGNLTYSKTARNGNPIMAMSADITIAEVNEIVEPGEIDPESVVTPGVFVKYLVLHK